MVTTHLNSNADMGAFLASQNVPQNSKGEDLCVHRFHALYMGVHCQKYTTYGGYIIHNLHIFHALVKRLHPIAPDLIRCEAR
jgi:hypothetical protein